MTLPLLFALAAPVPDTKPEIRIGVLARSGAAKALEQWEPTARYLDGALPDYRFRIVPIGFDDVTMVVDNALVDFVIVNPALYINLAVRFGVSRIATMKYRNPGGGDLSVFGSVLFAKKRLNGPQRPEDLKGQRIAAVHVHSLGGWIIMSRELRERLGTVSKAVAGVDFLGTHERVVEAIARGEYDAGIVRTATLEQMAQEGRVAMEDFTILGARQYREFPFAVTTRLYPEWPVSKLEHVSRTLAREVALALLQMPASGAADGAAALAGWTIPENYQEVESLLRELHLPPFESYGQVTLAGVWKNYGLVILLVGALLAAALLLWARASALNRRLRAKHRELELNEEMFKGTFEQAAVGLLHVTTEGGLLRFNQKLCQMTGYSCVELGTKNLNELIFERDLSASLEQIEALKRGALGDAALQVRIVNRSGEQLWTNLTVSAVRDDSGQIKYLIMAVDAISHLKTLEQAIARERHALSAILEMAGDGILGIDREGQHTFVNPVAAKLLGYEVGEMIGQESHRMWHHTRSDGSVYNADTCPITAVLREGITHRGDNELVWHRDGTPLYVDFISTPIVEEGGVVGAVIVFRRHSAPEADAGEGPV